MKATKRSETADLVHELTIAMQRALAESPDVATCLAHIRAQGYDASVVLETTIGLARAGDSEEGTAARLDLRTKSGCEAPFKMTPLDKKFLRSLRISVEEDE